MEETPTSPPKEGPASRESSAEPGGGFKDDNGNGDLVPYDKARRALKRIEQMNTIRQKVLTHPKPDKLLLKARKRQVYLIGGRYLNITGLYLKASANTELVVRILS